MRLPEGSHIGSDTETTGLFWRFGDRPYCFPFCNTKGETAVISFPVDPFTRQVKYDDRLDLLRDYYQDKDKTFYFHNATFDVGMIKSIGIEIRGPIVCTLSLIRLIKSNAPLKLKDFCARFLGIPTDDEEDLREATRKARREGKKKGYAIYENPKKKSEDDKLAPDYWLAGKKFFEPYALTDAARVMAVVNCLLPEIKKRDLVPIWNTELETWKVLRKVEERGIRVDKLKIINSKIVLKKKFQTYIQEAKDLSNNPNLNLRSPKQLCVALYDQCNQPVKFSTKGGNPSTDNAALKAMKHPLAKVIRNARAAIKTVEFMDQYLKFMVQHKDGLWYLHPNFHSSLAVTGRESCSDPNLQQVAKGKDEKIEVRVEARSVFCPRPDYSMRSYDWKNIEVYIPAFASGDKKLVKMLKAGEDIHDYTAKNLTKLCKMEIDREIGKRTFFGLQYGIGSEKLAKTNGISTDLADLIINGFSETYPGLWEWMNDLIRIIRRDRCITTMYGRKITVFPDEAYKGVNYFVQGTAGGILKSAKVKIHDYLSKRDGHIVLPIHDELLNEYRFGTNLEKMDRNVVGAMQDNPELNMPVKIPVSISAIGKNWAEKTKVAVL